MKNLLISLLLLLYANCFSQSSIQWGHQVSSSSVDNLENHVIDKDENVIAIGYFEGTISIAGKTIVSKDQSDIFLYKSTKAGTISWIHTFGGPVYSGDAGVSTDELGNIYVAGGFIEKLFFDNDLKLTGNSRWNSFVAKLSPQGNLIWIKGLIGQTTNSEVRVMSCISVNGKGSIAVAGTYDGNVLVDGNLVSKPLGDPGNSIILVKMDSDGNVKWIKNPPSTTFAQTRAVYIDQQDFIYMTGFFTTSISFDATSFTAANTTHSDIFIAKYNPDGSVDWAKGIIKTTDEELNNEGRALIFDETNLEVYLTGVFKANIQVDGTTIFSVNAEEQVADYFVSKFSENGELKFLRRYGTNYHDIVSGITLTNRNTFLVTGGHDLNFKLFFQEFDLSGNPLSIRDFNTTGIGSKISSTDDASLYLSGLFFSPFAQDVINFRNLDQDGFLIRVGIGELQEPEEGIIPNVITPNGDQYNQVFRLPDNLIGSEINIYNRWGQLVFSDSNYVNTWRGEEKSDGVYYYFLRTNCCGIIKGLITVTSNY